MPRKLSAADPAPAQLTPDERQELIQTAAQQIRDLDAQIDEVSAKRKALNKTKTQAFRTLKAKTGIARKNLEATLAILNLEDDERDDTIDQIRECYDALSEGETVNFLDAMEKHKSRRQAQEEERPAGHA